MSFTMPKNVYCTFDTYCLGVECCINVKLAMFLKVFKFWARFDPCSDPMQFAMAFDKYNYTIKIKGSLNFDGKSHIPLKVQKRQFISRVSCTVCW